MPKFTVEFEGIICHARIPDQNGERFEALVIDGSNHHHHPHDAMLHMEDRNGPKKLPLKGGVTVDLQGITTMPSRSPQFMNIVPRLKDLVPTAALKNAIKNGPFEGLVAARYMLRGDTLTATATEPGDCINGAPRAFAKTVILQGEFTDSVHLQIDVHTVATFTTDFDLKITNHPRNAVEQYQHFELHYHILNIGNAKKPIPSPCREIKPLIETAGCSNSQWP